MQKNDILLSLGSLPWMRIKQAVNFAKKTGYDGLEFLPTRKSINEKIAFFDLQFIKSIHQNWRLDIGHDESYGINFLNALFFILIRLILFPTIKKSNEKISLLSRKLNIPLVAHGISEKWTYDGKKNEFFGGILYEIIGALISPEELKNWMSKPYHNVVIDSRDDQSLMWAKKYGLNTWQAFWQWLNIKKIKNYQLTFIGIRGLKKIKRHENSLPEKQLLWLYKNRWRGYVTVEVNPLVVLFLFKGDMQKGFRTICKFVRKTLIEGKKWST